MFNSTAFDFIGLKSLFFLVMDDFCRQLVIFKNGLKTSALIWIQTLYTLIVFLNYLLEKKSFWKKPADDNISMKKKFNPDSDYLLQFKRTF